MQVEVEIDYDVFLPKYRHLVDSDADIFILWGGRDSGKSHFIAQLLIKDCLELPYFKCILSRKVQDTIKESQWATIKQIIEEWGLSSLFEFRVNPLEIRCVNGNKFIARGADKSGKVKGVKDPTHAWFEEMNQMSRDEYSVISTTLRSSVTRSREYWSFNPECEGNFEDFWLYKVVEDYYGTKTEIKTIHDGGIEYKVKYEFVHSTYDDNPFCPPERKSKYLNTTQGDDYLYGVWIRGFWGNQKIERPFAIAYNEKKHVEPCQYAPGRQMVISVDFNIDPFSAIVIQQWFDNGPKIRVVDEIEIGAGTIEGMADEIKRRYASDLPSMWITGDAMGNNRRLGNTDNKSLFRQLQIELNVRQAQLKVVPNPMHKNSRTQCNYFLTHFPDFKISDQCTGLRSDMRSVQVDLYGEILKKNRKDITQRADYLDCFRYYINTFQANTILAHQKSGRWN
jgi:phage terminase large subunit